MFILTVAGESAEEAYLVAYGLNKLLHRDPDKTPLQIFIYVLQKTLPGS